jgi:hypothetical protein
VFLAISCLVVFIVVIQVASAHSAAAGSTPKAAAPKAAPSAKASPRPKATTRPTPRAVTVAYLAAISRHDWPEVWKLGGKNVGTGPYASYAGMVAGYRGTVKDVLLNVRVSGQSAIGEFHAHESDGEVRTYAFSYLVRGGEIVHASVREVGSSR